ncbi:MAG: type II toxin-antitoxin system Phd/YefM family antitoxin [Nitrospira sp.]|jgi:prevent-host-death family protein|nr:type II toxin-antitoxin system Phd/YefM family antitoxin [Nitrospira sp.]
MLKTISAIKVRQNLGQVMNEVALKDDEYIIERAGKPLVAIIPIEQYRSMKKERKEFFQMVDEIQKGIKKVAGSLIDTEIEEAVQSYRKGISQKSKKTGK